MAAVRWTRHLKQLCWSTSTIGQRRDGTYMSVSSSSNFLRERHRTRHCYKSGMHIIYRNTSLVPLRQFLDHHGQLLFGRTIPECTSAFTLKTKAYMLTRLYFTWHLYSVLPCFLNSAVIYHKIYILIQISLTVQVFLLAIVGKEQNYSQKLPRTG